MRRPAQPPVRHASGRACVALLVIALGWGVFAFGAVYPWAYWTLLALTTGVAALGLFARSSQPTIVVSRGLKLGLAAIGAVVLLQLVPLPPPAIVAISPMTDSALRDLRLAYASGIETVAPLSIDPVDTAVGLALYAGLAVLLVGLTRALSITGVSVVADGIVGVGVTLAIVGIVQKPLYNGEIYGLWKPLSADVSPFGPFINRNHFAGWMLMALPVALGSLFAAFAERGEGRRQTLREWIVWFGSPHGNRVLATAVAAATMGLALVMTMSRSGITAFALSLVIGGWLFTRQLTGAARKLLVVSSLMLMLALAIGWTGVNVVAARFAGLDGHEFALRQDAWRDAIQIARRFPLLGTGLNTYGDATLLYQSADLTRHYTEAHNDYLQLAAEGGMLLVVPVLFAAVVLIRDAVRRARDATAPAEWWIRRGAIAGLLAIALQETVEFSLQMPGNAVLFTVLCAMVIHQAPQPRRTGIS